jgi:hypothetical protein
MTSVTGCFLWTLQGIEYNLALLSKLEMIIFRDIFAPGIGGLFRAVSQKLPVFYPTASFQNPKNPSTNS